MYPPFGGANPPFVASWLFEKKRAATLVARMKHNVTLTITSLLSILLFSLHWADEVARGIEPGTLSAVGGLLILAVWLCGTLVLAERRAGLIIILLGAILASGVPVLHMQGAGLVGGRIGNGATTAERFFWVWTNIALGASGMVSVVISARALWSLQRTRNSRHPALTEDGSAPPPRQ